MEQKNEIQFGELLRRIGISLKKNWLLMVIVIVIALSAGLGVALLRKPTYTAYEQANYKAQISDTPQLNDYTITLAYLDTFTDFCKQDCVVKRANYYYEEFIKANGSLSSVDEYIDSIRAEVVNDKGKSVPTYSGDTYQGEYDGERYIKSSDVTIYSSTDKDADISFGYVIGCKDIKREQSIIKVKLYTLAIDAEVKEKDAQTNEYKYFGIKIDFDDYGLIGNPVVDISRTKIVMVAGIIGIVASLICVYLSYILNRTVREKEELEMLTGVSVLAFIADNEGGK